MAFSRKESRLLAFLGSNDFAGTVIRAAKRKTEWKLIIKDPVAVKPFSRRFNGTSCFIMLPRLTWTISQICISRMHAFCPGPRIAKFYILVTSSENPSYAENSILHFPSGSIKQLKKNIALVRIRFHIQIFKKFQSNFFQGKLDDYLR